MSTKNSTQNISPLQTQVQKLKKEKEALQAQLKQAKASIAALEQKLETDGAKGLADGLLAKKLLACANAYFEQHKASAHVYITSDGQCFNAANHTYALEHAQNNGLEVLQYTRDDINQQTKTS